jgi:hypothetical protein
MKRAYICICTAAAFHFIHMDMGFWHLRFKIRRAAAAAAVLRAALLFS